jgi:hypothetical protein
MTPFACSRFTVRAWLTVPRTFPAASVTVPVSVPTAAICPFCATNRWMSNIPVKLPSVLVTLIGTLSSDAVGAAAVGALAAAPAAGSARAAASTATSPSAARRCLMKRSPFEAGATPAHSVVDL